MNHSPFNEHPLQEPRWIQPILDGALVVAAFVVAYIVRYDWQVVRPVIDPSRSSFGPYLPFVVIYYALLLLSFQGNGLYRNLRGRTWWEELGIIINSTMVATVILLALFFIFQPLVTSRLMLVYVAALTIVFLGGARLARRAILAHLRTKGIGLQSVLLVGMGETGRAVLRTMISRGELAYRVVGYLDDNPERGEGSLGRVPGLGRTDNLRAAVKSHSIDLVVITLRWKEYDRIMELSRVCRELGVQVRVVPDIFQLNMRQVQVENLDGIPLLGVNETVVFQGTSRFYKRALDLGLTLLTAPVWLVVMAVVALLIKWDDGGEVLYSQVRIGEGGKPFRMYKFRTMIPNADSLRQQLIEATGQDPRHPKIVDDPRITRVGRLLRKTSLDELPNLFNVLRGEMSLVGPRPPTPDEVALYDEWHRQRLQIMPGMTGLWQISGRSDVPFDEMCLMDIYYIENWSVKYDLHILLMTVPHVLLRNGAY
ncbi:MAG: sugar transferase [Anaerolineae bacterium]|nr:sugar transferase [Anaerolineae bacterium]MDW8173870.1 sugar transferase [Anaerolineae bacterium]